MKHYGLARDTNEQEIVTALQRLGCSIERLHTPCDLLVGYRGRTYLMEVKQPPGPRGGTSHSELTPEQRDFRDRWLGDFHVVRCVQDAMDVIFGSPRKPRSKR